MREKVRNTAGTTMCQCECMIGDGCPYIPGCSPCDKIMVKREEHTIAKLIRINGGSLETYRVGYIV